MKYIFLIISICLSVNVSAQKAADATESRRMIEEVCAAAGRISSLQCDFMQVKYLSLLKTAMKSEGKMCYKDGKLLRWEYTSPYTYTFVLDNDKVVMRSSQKTNVVDVKSSRMFQQIARIMMNSITGRCLSEAKDFEVTMYVVNGQWMAKLIPQQKEMRLIFEEIHLFIHPDRQMVTSVELIEKSGDTTRIVMENVKKNIVIDDSVFTVE